MASQGKKRNRCAFRPCPPETDVATSFFSFPKDPERAAVWLKACNREDLLGMDLNKLNKNYQLCDKHFDKKLITKGGTLPRLFQNAYPTIFSHSTHTATDIQDISEPNQQKKAHIEVLVKVSEQLPDIQCISGPSQPKKARIEALVKGSESLPGSSDIQISDDILECSAPLSSLRSPTLSTQTSTVSSPKTPIKSLLPSPTISTQTPASLSSRTPRKIRLKTQIRALRKQRRPISQEHQWTIKDFYDMCDKFLSKPLSDIVKAQAILKDKVPVARRYSAEYKQFALTLYFLGPRAYSFMSRLLCLPSKRTLERITHKLACKPGLVNDAIWNALQIKIQTMLELHKHCTLCMALKSNLFYHTGRDEIIGLHDIGKAKKEFSYAQNALVIMARGLYSNWKQPLAYFFLKSTFEANQLKEALEQCVLKLTETGLYVDALVSDMGSNFIELANSLGVTPENPEFQLAGANIIYLFDICHLIKATRNNLLNNSFYFNGLKTSWKFIEDFYKLDSKQFYRCAPKLTQSHINPSNFEKMSVKLAVQVLSHTVASGMNVYMNLGALPNDAIGTIEIIEKFNNLFDILNSLLVEEKDMFRKVFDGSESQVNYLNLMIDLLKDLKIFNKKNEDVTSRSRFIKRWLITINGVKKLWEKLFTADFKYLKTKRLNSDCLENFFGGIRQQGGNCINPTPIQFERAFRKLFSQNYLHSNNMNCKNDLDELLVRISANHLKPLQKENENENIQTITLPDYSYRHENMAYQNAFKYMCGYLLKKSLNIHQCEACIKFSKDCEELDTSQLLTYFKAYDTNKSIYGGLRTPNEQFINFVYNLEKTFVSNFEAISVETGISH